MSSPASPSFNPLRVKVEPKLPEQLTIEGPGQIGTTTDYLVGAVESLVAFFRTLPPTQEKLEIEDLRNQLAMKKIVAKNTRRSNEASLQELQEDLDQTTDAMHQYSEEYEEEIRELTRKYNNEKNRSKILENDAQQYLRELRDSRTENLTLKEEIKKLQKVEAEKKNAEKHLNVVAEKARYMEIKISRLEKEKCELQGRVQRREQAIEMEKKARHTEYYAFKKLLADSEKEKNDALNILEGIRKTMSESGAVKLAANPSAEPTPKPSITSSKTQKPGAVPPGSKSFAKPAFNMESNLTVVSTISNAPLPSPILPDSSHLPANSEPFDIIPTVRVMPYTAPNHEYAGWGSDDVQMGYRRDPIERTSEGKRHLSSSSTTKSSSSNRSRPY